MSIKNHPTRLALNVSQAKALVEALRGAIHDAELQPGSPAAVRLEVPCELEPDVLLEITDESQVSDHVEAERRAYGRVPYDY